MVDQNQPVGCNKSMRLLTPMVEKQLKWIAEELFKVNAILPDFKFETADGLFQYLKDNYQREVLTDETLDKIFLNMGGSGNVH